tara:strand:+ start:224 stop:469 length:246 start_codon:yes stop_codon:yes gene_type:complete
MKKLLRLNNEPWILADVSEIPEAEYGQPDCILEDPITLDGKRWPEFSADYQIVVRSTDIIVMVTPTDDVLNTAEAKELLTE